MHYTANGEKTLCGRLVTSNSHQDEGTTCRRCMDKAPIVRDPEAWQAVAAAGRKYA